MVDDISTETSERVISNFNASETDSEQNINLLSENNESKFFNDLVELKNKDNQFINNKPTVIFFHGNSGNIGNRLGFVESYVKKVDVNVVIGNLYY